MKTKLNRQALRRLALPATLVLGLVLVGAGFNGLLPKATMHGPGARTRTGWYLASGQWRADARTLSSAVEYVLSPDANPISESSVAVRGRAGEKVHSPVNAALGMQHPAW